MKKIILALCAGLLLASAAHADEKWNRHGDSYFIEANGGVNAYTSTVFTSEGDVKSSGFKGYGWNMNAGHMWNDLFGWEVGFMQHYMKFENDNREYKYAHMNVPYASMRFNVPIEDRAFFIGKIGLMRPGVHGSWAVIPYTGIGFGYALSEDLDFTVQYQGIVYAAVNYGLLSGGLTYRFA